MNRILLQSVGTFNNQELYVIVRSTCAVDASRECGVYGIASMTPLAVVIKSDQALRIVDCNGMDTDSADWLSEIDALQSLLNA